MSIDDLNNETTENLLSYIQWKDEPEYEEVAKEAFRVFTFKFQLDLLKKLITICKNWGYDEQVANEITYNSFARIWKYPNFDISLSNQKDVDKAVIFYLYGIAKRQLADYKKVQNGDLNPFTGDEIIIREFPDLDIMNIKAEKKTELKKKFELIQSALNRLTPKHKIIYLTYKQFDSEIKEGFNLPRKLLRDLRDELDLTQSSIRVYKKEVFTEVDNYLKIYGTK